MDITDKFLPNEKFLTKYDEVTVDRRSGFSIVVTNLRIFIANKYELWDIQTDKIDYLGRAFIPRFAWWWQFLFIPLAMISVSNPLFFGIFILLSVARQFIRVEALVLDFGPFCLLLHHSDFLYYIVIKEKQMNSEM